MTFAWGVVGACSLPSVRLDMMVSWNVHRWTSIPPIYDGNRCFVTAMHVIRLKPSGVALHKKASRVAPARLLRTPRGLNSRGRCYDGIRTVSTTWITPLD